MPTGLGTGQGSPSCRTSYVLTRLFRYSIRKFLRPVSDAGAGTVVFASKQTGAGGSLFYAGKNYRNEFSAQRSIAMGNPSSGVHARCQWPN
ncbi:hypothetical protein D3C85_940140 [compost metagenome]